ncbi:MAG: hypothetical protein EOO62_02030 [Hymenobacter sp.]|nr:MAG: hypothetical protein EOO62_02030 [Hymenobacter sp.]
MRSFYAAKPLGLGGPCAPAAYPTAHMHLLKKSFLTCLLAGLLGCTTTSEVRVDQRKTHLGNWYTLFYPQDLAIRVVTTRPRTHDSRYQLSVAAAYTDLQTNEPLDLLVADGRVRQAKATVGFLDGVLTSAGNTLTITQIPKGQSPTSAQLETICHQQV